MEMYRNERSGDNYHSDWNDPNNESEKSLQDLLNGCCLPESILNKYMELITNYSPNTLYAFNTHFFTAFSDHGYSRVHRWTKNVDIFSKEKLFIPVYFKSTRMWSLINVNFKEKSIRYYDIIGSGYHGGNRCQQLILKYLKLEYFMRKRKFFCVNRWSYVSSDFIHHGYNFWDSGLFMCLAAYEFAKKGSKSAARTFCSEYIGGQEKIKKMLISHIKKNSIL